MNGKQIIFLILSLFFVSLTNAQPNNIKIQKEHLLMADPTIFYHDGIYYLYGTGGDSDHGFLVYISKDLENWEGPVGASSGYALVKGDSYGTKWFWAPQVFYHNGKFYMAYTANEQIAIASADSPLGPFKQKEVQPISTTTRQIDPFVFFDNDGKIYMYHVRLQNGNRIFVAEMNKELTSMDETTLKECISAQAGTWEDTQNVEWKVAEGPTVIKEKNLYYLFYSINDFRNIDYAVGYATSKYPYGPWKRDKNNPLINRHNTHHNGSGHGDLVFANNKIHYVLHTHHSDSVVSPRKTGIVELETGKKGYQMKNESFKFLYVDAKTYKNPVISANIPDPTLIETSTGDFYLYSTESNNKLPIYHSRNLLNWEHVGSAFTEDTRPSFEPNAGIWAPDINYINGKYVMYYSMSVWGGEWTCGIGVATADKPEGPFKDNGKIFRSNEIGVQNSIDPFYMEDNGKKYLFWGSFRGIYVIELSNDGLSIKKDAQKIQVAGTAYEGTYIHKRDGFYYLFASIGSCCEGLNSTYTTVVGRSKNLFGPYVDKSSNTMMDNKHEVIIRKDAEFVGTGHNSEIITDKLGNDWILYHAVNVSNPNERCLMLGKISWVNGWPQVTDANATVQIPFF